MTEKTLIAILGLGKGTWGHVARLISETEWKKIILISNDWGKENFKPAKEADWILVNNRMGFELLVQQIADQLPAGKCTVSLASGSGKEHMALINALKTKSIDFEFVTLTGEGVKYF